MVLSPKPLQGLQCNPPGPNNLDSKVLPQTPVKPVKLRPSLICFDQAISYLRMGSEVPCDRDSDRLRPRPALRV